jgi:photosystem II stability/assembly factor-like uncharacterized protein
MKLNTAILLAGLSLLCICCNKKNDQTPTPTPGPTGIWVNTNFSVSNTNSIWSMLVTRGGRILVGTNISYGNPSLYASTDTGATWHLSDSLNPVRVNGTPYCIKQDPVTNRVLIGCNSQQLQSLFTSTDDGNTWVNNPNIFSPIDFVFMNNKAYMSIQNGVAPNPPKYLMSSTDDFSSNWTDCTPNTAITPYRLLADNGSLFVGSIGANGLYRTSTPEGRTYTRTDNGITYANPGTSWVQRMVRKDSYIFTATTDGVFRSSDGGSSWTPCNLGFSRGANDFAVVGSDIYVALTDSAVYKSSDNGATWSAFHQGLTLPLTVNCLQVIGNYLLEGDGNSKVYKIKLN